MITDTSARILSYLRTNKQAKAIDLVRNIGITNSAIHRQLNKLLARGEVIKVGKPPLVFYILKEKQKQINTNVLSDIEDFINKNYIYVSPAGEMLTGMDGFARWASSVHQEKYFPALAQEYVKVRKEADAFINLHGWIDATDAKERKTFGDKSVDKLLYKDFYSIEKFGKTQLRQMVLYAKTSQNLKIIEDIIKHVKPVINTIIQKYTIDTIAYIPPSIKRNIQLMTELKNRLNIQLPEVTLVKAYAGDVIVSQKSLSKFQERVMNAQRTIFIDIHKSASHPKNVLIIDDAVGSGATIHETAIKIKELLHPEGRIIGFAIVGSMKAGFAVEVHQ